MPLRAPTGKGRRSRCRGGVSDDCAGDGTPAALVLALRPWNPKTSWPAGGSSRWPPPALTPSWTSRTSSQLVLHAPSAPA
eukprot:5838412-Heterocapsa_arctica.AAC.1